MVPQRMEDGHSEMLVLVSIKDCGRSEKGNRAGLADSKGSSADGNSCEGVIG